MKKIKAIIFILITMLPAPLTAMEQNLVPNPDFTIPNSQGTGPCCWEYRQNFVSPASRGEARGLWQDEGIKGGRSISIAEERWFSSSQWGAKVKGIEENTFYLFSLSARRDAATGWLPMLRLFNRSRTINIKTPGEYRYFEFLLDSEETSGSTDLALIVHRKPSVIWFDDLRLVKFEPAPLSPRNGLLSKSRSPVFSWKLPEHGQALTYDLEIKDREGNTAVFKDIAVPRFTAPDLKPGSYSWRVSVYSGSVMVSKSNEQVFRIVKDARKQSTKPENRFFKTADLKFEEFPIGINYLPEEKIPGARAAGINWVFGAREAAPYSEAGIKVIASPGTEGADIYYLFDEPDQRGVLPGEIRERHFGIKNINPAATTAVAVYDPARYAEYAGVSDILMADPYPVPVRPLSSVPEAVKAARKTRSGRNVWAIIQAFNWAHASAEARREGIARLPTEKEIRAMSHMAIAAGAEGIILYTFGEEGGAKENLLDTLFNIASEISSMDAFLAAPGGESSIDGHFYILQKEIPEEGLYRLAVNSSPRPKELDGGLVEGYGAVFEKTASKQD